MSDNLRFLIELGKMILSQCCQGRAVFVLSLLSLMMNGVSFFAGNEALAGVDSEAPSVVLFIGDSLTQGYGVKKQDAFPELVGEILRKKGHRVKIINGGISGSVSADADRRLRWYLKSLSQSEGNSSYPSATAKQKMDLNMKTKSLPDKTNVLVLSLGANDAFKGTPPAVIKKNLAATIDLAKANGLKVILGGMKVFTNFGKSYTEEFERLYQDLATEKKVTLIPFLLEGVALKRELNLPDMKHPNESGHQVIAERVAKEVEKLLPQSNQGSKP